MLKYSHLGAGVAITYRLVAGRGGSITVEVVDESPTAVDVEVLARVMSRRTGGAGTDSPRERLQASVAERLKGFNPWMQTFVGRLAAEGITVDAEIWVLVAEKYLLRMEEKEIVGMLRSIGGGGGR